MDLNHFHKFKACLETAVSSGLSSHFRCHLTANALPLTWKRDGRAFLGIRQGELASTQPIPTAHFGANLLG